MLECARDMALVCVVPYLSLRLSSLPGSNCGFEFFTLASSHTLLSFSAGYWLWSFANFPLLISGQDL